MTKTKTETKKLLTPGTKVKSTYITSRVKDWKLFNKNAIGTVLEVLEDTVDEEVYLVKWSIPNPFGTIIDGTSREDLVVIIEENK